MSWSIPKTNIVSLRQGDTGIVVWSLQRLLAVVTADGSFGPLTESAIKAFQRNNNLVADGIAGPATQKALVKKVLYVQQSYIPAGLLEGFAEGEGGWLIGAVNWSIPGGVDCGVFQRRVYNDAVNDYVIQHAFDTNYQAYLLASSLINLHDLYIGRMGAKDGYGGLDANEKAWRLAALNHNYPAGSERLSTTPISQLSSYWTSPEAWVENIGVKFPDGTAVRTPLQWCHFYAGVLGNGVHGTSGIVTKYAKF